MILQYGQKEFDESWLELVKHDPVHPKLCTCKRISGHRTIFVFIHNDIPQAMVCVRIGNYIPHTMSEVLNDDEYQSKYDITYATFYSIFRLPNATVKGVGTLAINKLIAECKLKGINNFYTLSPVPLMKEHLKDKPSQSVARRYLESLQEPVSKFHLSNGARLHRINFDADYSEIRLHESWGIMVNYDYNRDR
jgi:malonyl-CoA decarboxylase